MEVFLAVERGFESQFRYRCSDGTDFDISELAGRA